MAVLNEAFPTVIVAVGIVINAKGEVLLAQRPLSNEYAGLWEFPGGKVEVTETLEEGLIRELKEEIGIELTDFHWLVQVKYTYPNKQVVLNVWYSRNFKGRPQGLEGQTLKWVHPLHLKEYSFLAANDIIIDALLDRFKDDMSITSPPLAAGTKQY